MGDFVEQTALEPLGDGRFRADISEDWRLWGPAGGLVSAMALRAAGEVTRLARPASFACQYVSFARFAPVELAVTSLRAGRRTEALRVEMSQEGKLVLSAQVWAVEESRGMVHDRVPVPEVPDPDDLPNMEALKGDAGHPYYENFERRPIHWHDGREHTPGEPEIPGWYRFRPRARASDPFVDGARAVVLLDTFTWPTIYGVHPEVPSPWIAPSLDLYVRFHRDTTSHEWLYACGRADLAEDGLLAAAGTVWSRSRQLLASGATQLLCQPRPERFK